MLKIATHDSATGEKPTLWSSPLTLFARTQSKTIKEQLAAGAREFDIRVKKVCKKWRCAHGWWFTKREFSDIMEDFVEFTNKHHQVVHLQITFEGKTKNAGEFTEYIKEKIQEYKEKSNGKIKFGSVCSKYGSDTHGLKVKYETLIPAEKGWLDCPNEQAFLPLDGRSWHTYIPIPWLWKQFYFKNVEFTENVYKFVDFL